MARLARLIGLRRIYRLAGGGSPVEAQNFKSSRGCNQPDPAGVNSNQARYSPAIAAALPHVHSDVGIERELTAARLASSI